MSTPSTKRVTTATARAEHTPRAAPTYDPRERVPPVEPSIFESRATFKFDDFVSERRYMRANPQGESERLFDAEKHPATSEYRSRVEAQRLDSYVDEDILIEEEREAALIPQPDEAIRQFEHDIQNPRLLNTLKGPVTRSAQPSAELQRRQALQRDADRRLAVMANVMAQSTDQNPDFFTKLDGYEAPQRKEVLSGRDTALLEALEAEIADLADNEDIEDDAEFNSRRAELEAERDALIADAEAQAARIAQTLSSSSTPSARSTVQLIADPIARQLLEINPLDRLHASLRSHFLALPEPSLVCRLLYPLLLQHEQHKQHVNAIELIRALALCGAKYDGFNVLRSKRRLSHLIDTAFYASFIDPESGLLMHGHEHYDRDETKFVVFKFFVVRRNKANDELLSKAGSGAAQSSGATGGVVPNDITDEQATNIDNRLDENERYKHLNKAGLYDADQTLEDAEDDGTDEYGSLHDIKYLEREFMFSLRVVCVQPTHVADTERGYPSEDDNDFVLPHGSTPLAPAAEEQDEQTLHLESATSNRVQSTLTDSRHRTSSSNFAARSSSVRRFDDDDDDDDAGDPVTYDDPAFVHTDDEQDDTEQREQIEALQTKEFWPRASLCLTRDQAEALVGKWKAADFLDRIERQMVGVLCVRSFMFYATVKPN